MCNLVACKKIKKLVELVQKKMAFSRIEREYSKLRAIASRHESSINKLETLVLKKKRYVLTKIKRV